MTTDLNAAASKSNEYRVISAKRHSVKRSDEAALRALVRLIESGTIKVASELRE